MKAIKEIAESIREELEDAEHYALCSAKLKDSEPGRSAVYAEMAREELSHADRLHNMAVDLIAKHRADGHETPAAMKAVWEWEHENMITKTASIRMLLSAGK